MIGIVRDIVRAFLVLVVGVVLHAVWREVPPVPAAPPAAWQPAPGAWQPAQWTPPPERPLRRVAAAITELGDSVIGVVR